MIRSTAPCSAIATCSKAPCSSISEHYEEAIKSYSNVSSLYPNEPFVVETFVQIAHCWQRLDRAEKAHGAIQQAQLTLDRLPKDVDFAATTAFSRTEWQSLLTDMSKW